MTKRIFHFLLILCFPAVLLQALPVYPPTQQTFYNEKGKEIFIPRDESGKINPWGYFDPVNIFSQAGYINHYFDFIDLLKNEEFLENLTEKEFSEIINFVISVVRYSVPESRPDLKEQYEQEIEELLQVLYNDEEELFFSINRDQKPEFRLCSSGGWIGKQCRQLGRWCDKHKTPLIIGTVIVGVVVITVMTGGVGASSATAVGGALAGGVATTNDNPSPINKPGEVGFQENTPYVPLPSSQTDLSSLSNPVPEITHPSNIDNASTTLDSPYEEMVYEQAETLKEQLTVEILGEPFNVTEESFWDTVKEKARDTASYIAHTTYDAVAEIGECWHQLNPSSGPEELAVYREQVVAEHEVIDEIFGTNLANNYSQEASEADAATKEMLAQAGVSTDMQIGYIPPPGGLVGIAGKVVDAVRTTGAIAAGAVGSVVLQPTNSNISAVEQHALNEISALQNTLPEGHHQLERGISQICNNQNLNEEQFRGVLNQCDYHPPPRPEGIPEDWKAEVSDKGGGVKYSLTVPQKSGESYTRVQVRVMPANPNSPKPGQQRPYVIHRIENKFYDKDGNIVEEDSFEAHIDYNEYDFEKISSGA